MITACIALAHRHLKVCGCKNINHQYSLASRAQEKEYSPHYKSMWLKLIGVGGITNILSINIKL